MTKGNLSMIYFDYSATSPVHPEAARSVSEVMMRYYGNPSSLHRLGVEAERLLTRAREQIADLLRVPHSTLIFTSGGSESNNLAIKGVASRWSSRGRHIITSAIEHPSVYEACRQLERDGYELTVLPVDAEGRVQPSQVEKAIREDTVLVSIMQVNSEIGSIQPIQEISAVLRRYPKVIFHVDAVQAAGKMPVHPEELGVDLLTISGHKFGAPKGIGLLYKREGIELEPQIAGGGQEGGLRSGTENVPYIVGMAKAFRLALADQAAAWQHVSELRNILLDRLADVPGLQLNSPSDAGYGVPHIVNFSCVGLKSEVVVHALEQRGFCISSRSACSSRDNQPSRVLLALGLSEELAASGLRISLAKDHTKEQVERLAAALQETVSELRHIMR